MYINLTDVLISVTGIAGVCAVLYFGLLKGLIKRAGVSRKDAGKVVTRVVTCTTMVVILAFLTFYLVNLNNNEVAIKRDAKSDQTIDNSPEASQERHGDHRVKQESRNSPGSTQKSD